MDTEDTDPMISVNVKVPASLIDEAMRILGRTQSETVRVALARLVGRPDGDAVVHVGWKRGRPRKRNGTTTEGGTKEK